MKITRKKVGSVIRVDKNFATLIDIDRPSGDFLYEFVYTANQIEAIKQSAIEVDITVLDRFPSPEGSIFSTGSGIKTPEKIIENIRLRRPTTKDQRRGNRRDVIKRVVSDISTGISNAAASKIAASDRANVKKSLRQEIKLESVSRDDATRANKDLPVLQTQVVKNISDDSMSFRKAAIRSILRDGVDPASIPKRSGTISTSSRNIAGLTSPESSVQTIKSREGDTILKRLLGDQDSSVSKSSALARGSDKIVTIKREPRERVEITTRIRFPNSDLADLDNFFVQFQLRSSSGRILSQEIRRVGHAQAVTVFNTPRIPPVVCFSPFRRAGKNSIEISQVDPRSEKVLIYRKPISATDPTLQEVDYQFVGEFQVAKTNGLQKIVDIVNNSRTIIYRVIPVGPGNIVGAIFSNVVVPGVETPGINRSRRLLSMSLTARITEEGILIDGSEIPPGPIALKIVRRDLTLFEKEFSIVNDVKPVRIVNETSNVSFLDISVKKDHIYEYAGILIFEDGDEEISTTGRTILKFSPLTQNVVDTAIGEPEIISRGDKIDVRFSIESRPVENSLDVVKRTLERQGLIQFYSSDIENERDLLEKLVTHGIKRIDLVSGEIENLGTFSGDVFSDQRAISLASANPLIPGRRYRYLISPQLRSPETMLTQLEKTKKNSRDGREYSFSPRKYLNPLTLRKGTIVTDTALISNHAEDEFALGAVGSIVEVEIDLGNIRPQIEKPQLLRLDRGTVIIRWNLRGDANAIDHFVVCLHRSGMKEFAGTVHNISKSGTFEMIDNLREAGSEFHYSITPIFDDYDIGPSVATNRMTI